MEIKTVGSICSGIEAASVAWKDLNFKFKVRFENETVVCGKKVDLNIFELEKKDLKP